MSRPIIKKRELNLGEEDFKQTIIWGGVESSLRLSKRGESAQRLQSATREHVDAKQKLRPG